MADKKSDYDRGQIVEIKLKRPIILNENVVARAIVEIDHINYGLDRKTRKLNRNKRSSFTLEEIEQFIMELDGEDIHLCSWDGAISNYEHRVQCPVKGRFYGKAFIMIFDLDYYKPDLIHTITLFPGW
jgi:hypothetical protein